MHEKHQKRLIWAIILSETSHVFCCVLPTVVSLFSLLAGFGLVVTLPGWLHSMHEFMHEWEPVMITVSVVMIALGWALHFYSKKIDCCHATGCFHGPCTPRKKVADKILIAATVLMMVNIGVYFGLHRSMGSQHAESLDPHGHHHDR